MLFLQCKGTSFTAAGHQRSLECPLFQHSFLRRLFRPRERESEVFRLVLRALALPFHPLGASSAASARCLTLLFPAIFSARVLHLGYITRVDLGFLALLFHLPGLGGCFLRRQFVRTCSAASVHCACCRAQASCPSSSPWHDDSRCSRLSCASFQSAWPRRRLPSPPRMQQVRVGWPPPRCTSCRFSCHSSTQLPGSR